MAEYTPIFIYILFSFILIRSKSCVSFQLLPVKYKVENNEKTQHVIDDAKKVAVAGLQGKLCGFFWISIPRLLK